MIVSNDGRARPETADTKDFLMADKPKPKDTKTDARQPRRIIHLGMMGDGTEEQNLGELGDPDKRIKEDEVDAAFNGQAPKMKPRQTP
jgi:hypothetical protein